jgi:NAD(P)-dependent dehydrogenase (short-subunit alcohol dehydrogenase family)
MFSSILYADYSYGVTIADHSARSLSDLFSLAGRRAVVTGGAIGLGAQIVRRLAEAGADVIAGDIDTAGVVAHAAEVASATGRRIIGCHLDVADSSTLAAVADRAVAELGGLDIWVNNAGIFPATGPAIDVADEFIDRMLTVNTRGTFAGAREAARRMANGGVIINMVSTAGFKGSLGISAYSASKHAVVGITKSLALEFGPLDIRVLGIAPTVMNTPGVQAQMAPLKAAGLDLEARLSANPLGRMGVPDDIARVVVFACSDLAAYMTGSTLLVDAGSLC